MEVDGLAATHQQALDTSGATYQTEVLGACVDDDRVLQRGSAAELVRGPLRGHGDGGVTDTHQACRGRHRRCRRGRWRGVREDRAAREQQRPANCHYRGCGADGRECRCTPTAAAGSACADGFDRWWPDDCPLPSAFEECGQLGFDHRVSRSSARPGSSARTFTARDSRLFTVPMATPSTEAICGSVRWA